MARVTVVEELIASQGSADGNGKRKPLQLEDGRSSDQDGRRDVDAGDVLRCQWARGLRGVGRHWCESAVFWWKRVGCHRESCLT